MLQIAIVEDEADLAQQTKDNVVRYLNEHGLEGNIAVFNDGMDIAENYKPIWDILLLDIEMPLLDGMSAAQKIREQDATVVMIFITRMAKYAIKGYEVDALDFILKPITYAQLSMKLPRAIERASQRQKHHLFVTVNGEKQRVESSAIYYIEVRGHWLYLHLHNQTLEVSGSLQEIEDRLHRPIAGTSRLHLDTSGRYEEGFNEYTSGSGLEFLLADNCSKPCWVRSRVEFDDDGNYYIVGHKGLNMDGLETRTRK